MESYPTCPATGSLLKHPFTAIVAGSTMAGKTFFLIKLLKYRAAMITPLIERVIFSYKRYQPVFDTLDGVEFVCGTDYQLDPDKRTLLILDDQVSENIDIVRLFTVDAHHSNCSVVLITQNLFHDSKEYRTAALNAMYLFLFKSPRGAMQVSHLARQLYPPAKAKKMLEAYGDATSDPYSYLMLDLKADTPEALRLRTHILPMEGVTFDGHALTRCYKI